MPRYRNVARLDIKHAPTQVTIVNAHVSQFRCRIIIRTQKGTMMLTTYNVARGYGLRVLNFVVVRLSWVWDGVSLTPLKPNPKVEDRIAPHV